MFATTVRDVFKRDPSKKPEYVLTKLLVDRDPKTHVAFVQGEYTSVLNPASIVRGRRVTITHIDTSGWRVCEWLLEMGDKFTAITVSVDGADATSLLRDSFRGKTSTCTTRVGTLTPEDDEAASRVSTTSFSTLHDKNLEQRFSAPATRTDSLQSTLKRLQSIDPDTALKGTVKTSFMEFMKLYEDIAAWLLPLARSNGVCVASHVATLDKYGCKAAKAVGFFLLRPRLGISSPNLVLNKLRTSLSPLNDHKKVLEEAQTTFLLSRGSEATTPVDLRRSYARAISTDQVDSWVRVHKVQPLPMFRAGQTDELLTKLIQDGNVPTLDQVARDDAKARGLTLPQAMADFAKRVPAVRLAIKSGQTPVLTWLVAKAFLECVDPPAAPSLHLEEEEHAMSTSELADRVSNTEERKFMASFLSNVISTRHFAQTSIEYFARDDSSVTIQELLDLTHHITHVTQLSHLESLASCKLNSSGQLQVMLAAFDVVLEKELVIERKAYRFFVNTLKRTCNGRVPDETRLELEDEARGIKVKSAKWAVELQNTVAELKATSRSHGIRLASCERSIASLDACVTAMQIEAADANDQKRFVSVISTVLSVVCAPIHQVVDAWFDSSDPIRLLRMIVDIPQASDIQRFITEEAFDYVLQPGVDEALRALHLDTTEVVAKLRVAAQQQQYKLPQEEAEDIYIMEVAEDSDEENEYVAPRPQLYEVVRDLMATMKNNPAR